jgi:selenocysteine-specific elongation factor
VEAALGLRLARAGTAGCDPLGLAPELGCTREQAVEAASRLEGRGEAVRGGARLFDAQAWRDAAERARAHVAEHHRARPLAPGASRETLRAAVCADMPQESWREFLTDLERRGDVRLEGEAVASADHRVVLEGEAQALAERIRDRFRAAGLEPPELEAVVAPGELARALPVVELLVARGELVRVQSRRLFHAEALAALRAKLRDYAGRSRTIDVAAFKELAGVTRKNAIPLLEHLDGERATRRVGDKREILL